MNWVFITSKRFHALGHIPHVHGYIFCRPNFHLDQAGGILKLDMYSNIVAHVCWALDLTFGYSATQGFFLDMTDPVELECVARSVCTFSGCVTEPKSH